MGQRGQTLPLSIRQVRRSDSIRADGPQDDDGRGPLLLGAGQGAVRCEPVQRRQGRQVPTKTPFGYIRVNGCLEPHPVNGPRITEAYKRAARDGIQSATRYLEVSSNDARRILSNRVYLGEIHHETAGTNLDAHKPLIDFGTWTQAQSEPRQRARPGNYVLSGIARCATCGGPMIGHFDSSTSNGKQYEYRRYRCSNRWNTKAHRDKHPCARGASINAADLDAIIRETLRQVIAHGAVTLSDDAQELSRAEDVLRATEANLAAYAADSELQELLGIEAWKAGAAKRRQDVEQARDRYQAEAAKVKAAMTLPAATELDDDEQLTRALNALVKAIDVQPGRSPIGDRVSIRWLA